MHNLIMKMNQITVNYFGQKLITFSKRELKLCMRIKYKIHEIVVRNLFTSCISYNIFLSVFGFDLIISFYRAEFNNLNTNFNERISEGRHKEQSCLRKSCHQLVRLSYEEYGKTQPSAVKLFNTANSDKGFVRIYSFITYVKHSLVYHSLNILISIWFKIIL